MNRTSNVDSIPTQNSTSDANDRLTSDNYDSNGSTTGSSGNGYAYDFENHLTSLNNGAQPDHSSMALDVSQVNRRNMITPVFKLDRQVGFVNEIFRVMADDGSETRAVDLLMKEEKDAKLELTTVVPFPPPTELPEELFQSHVEGYLYDFLSATNLVLGAAEASRVQILFLDGYALRLGIREWGFVISTWANRVSWLGRSDWQFGEFTGGPSDANIENYNYWSATVGPGTIERLFEEIEKYDSHERAETFEYLRRALQETRSSGVRVSGSAPLLDANPSFSGV